ncbi:jg9366 [Pararge aegeria aegeria]|uniref:Jg9366 protein n=1 Tax=Pararge aegeria aegeria TaxID=348720 RepID=A0A8S4RXQ8_9NEOP|nr:jg9366 [Pararge aegeria aegeria]
MENGNIMENFQTCRYPHDVFLYRNSKCDISNFNRAKRTSLGTALDNASSPKLKLLAKKLGILNKVKRYFTPEQLLTLYQAQVRSCMEYCSHLWDGSAKYQLDALDSVDRRARRLIGNDLVVSRLQSLEHRRKVACLAVFYKIHFGECAQELFDLVKPSPFYHRTARHRKNLHPYVVEIPSTRTKRFASSFLIRTAKAWNALPSSVFPDTYNLGIFKSRVNRHLLGKRASS